MRTVVEIAEAVRTRAITAAEVVEQCLASIAERNPAINAFVHVDEEGARREASRIDGLVASGVDPGPLAGVPFGVKDLEDCAGMPTAYGSLLYKGRAPVEVDSIQVARMRAAGGVPIGKTATPEFGVTCFTSTKAFGTTRNPWRPDRTPGGSSGGSAAAVAAGMVPFCTASDGGGSTRIPASFSGLVGLKPTYGRIPRTGGGVSATAVAGALTTSVADAARHLDVVVGPDPRDRSSWASITPALYEEAIVGLDVRGLNVVWSDDQGFATVDPEVAQVAHAAALALADSAGLRLVDRAFAPDSPLEVWMRVTGLDMWMALEEGMWPDRSDDLTGLVRGVLESTEWWGPAMFAEAFKRRNRLDEEVGRLFEEVDVLMTPTTAGTAFAAEGPLPMVIAGRDAPTGPTPLTMLANLCWNPAISVPAGTSADGLPIGLQIIARRGRDDVCLRLAHILEELRPWPRLASDSGG